MTISYIIPSLVGLDKTLENLATNYTHFNKALRTGLRLHFQDLMHQKDMILATVLDPRIKLQVETIAVDLICSIKPHLMIVSCICGDTLLLFVAALQS